MQRISQALPHRGHVRAESQSITLPCRDSHGQCAVASGDGWQAGARTAISREPNQGMEGRSRDSHGHRAKAGDGWQAGTGQQGHFCVSRKGTDNRKATGAFLRKQKGDGQQGSLRAECRSSKGAEGKQGSI